MGISGLHPVLKPYLAQSHARNFRGCRVGVDASAWLHRGAVGAARELATGKRPWEARGFDAPWVAFCLKMVAMLQAAGANPVLVFDGCRLPAKSATNAQRRQRREEARERALKLLREGRESEANAAFTQAINITPEMAHELIVRLRERGVDFVVAPYEADAQLAHLSSIPEAEGGVAAVVTEDSDLVGYGCRRVLFKMDSGGYCWELSLDRLFAGPEAALHAAASATQGSGGSENDVGNAGSASTSAGGSQGAGKGGGRGGSGALSFRGWTLDMLQAACVLAGCDFLPSLKGVSFRTAAGFVARRRSLEGALKALQGEKRFRSAVTEEYKREAARAPLAFKHALVFCHNTAGGSVRRLTPLPADSPAQQQQQQGQQPEQRGQLQQEQQGSTAAAAAGQGQHLIEADLAHLGAELDAEVARGIAYGYLHPHTLQPFAAGSGGRDGGSAVQHRQHDQPQPQQRQQQHAQQQQHQQEQQQHHQFRASLAGRQQLGSWMAAAAHGPTARLGPSQQHHHHQQQQQQGGYPDRRCQQHLQQQDRSHSQRQHSQQQLQQQQWLQGPQQQQLGAVNVSDVLQLYKPPEEQAAQPAGQQRAPSPSYAAAAAAAAPAQRNPFARLQGGAPSAAAGPSRGHAGAAVLEQQGSMLQSITETQASTAPVGGQAKGPADPQHDVQPHQQEQLQQQEELVPDGPATGADSQSACASGQGSAAVGGSGAGPGPAQASLAWQAQQQSQQQRPQQQLWDRDEQYGCRSSQSAAHAGAWSRPPAAAGAAGTKRKSSGSSSGASRKKGARQLAPPSQLISRFFKPAPRPQ
ncbi:hypothetical protein ABPG75_011568 [Micractinium tetrahymenae]